MKQEIIRKLSAAVAMSLVVGVSLAACGGSSSSLQGQIFFVSKGNWTLTVC